MRLPATLICVLLVTLAPWGTEMADADEAEKQNQGIRQHRMGTLTVRCEPGARVRVTQLSHDFWFGTAVSTRVFREGFDPEARRRYLSILAENFNSAVHENALKWYATERRRGRVSYEHADRILQWCEGQGIRMRGHCIFWGVPRHVQPWLKELDDTQLREAVERRAREVPSRYRGRILEYDVNNEMIHGGFYRERLGAQILVNMFRWAQQEDPDALLFVNDYRILSGRDAAEYERHIRWLLDHGAPVGGIGCQGHFREEVDMEQVRSVLDRLAGFDLPVRVTEFDIELGDEQRKARFLEEFYRTCFAHPAVEGILMWGFWEGAHWRPKAALWKQDFSPTPAARAYRELVFEEWWTRWEGTAEERGECRVPVFFGRHRVEVNGAAREIELLKEHRAVELTCTGPDPDAWAVSRAAVGQ